MFSQAGAIDGHTFGSAPIFSPAKEFLGFRAGQRNVWSGMPAAEPGRPERVVGEKKIVNRMLFSASGPRLMRVCPLAYASFVSALSCAPFLGTESNFL